MTEQENEELAEVINMIMAKISNLAEAQNKKFDTLKKVIGDYLELSSNISIATIKANLKTI